MICILAKAAYGKISAIALEYVKTIIPVTTKPLRCENTNKIYKNEQRSTKRL